MDSIQMNQKLLEEGGREPLGNEEINTLYNDVWEAITNKLYTEVGFGIHEKQFPGYEARLKNNFHESKKTFETKNANKVKLQCQMVSSELSSEMQDELQKIRIPSYREEIEMHAERLSIPVLQKYSDLLSKFHGTNGYQEGYELLEKIMKERKEDLIDINAKELKRLTTKARLEASRKLTRDIDNFYLSWSFKRHARQVMMEELSGEFQSEMAAEIVHRFVNEDISHLVDKLPINSTTIVIATTVIVILLGALFLSKK
eukprot:TRINITY_DN3526_c0_g1_i1.p1 TRINITY_DN3526_c0_g1~~TRINITY_DN3526_c0_g1_i1.p1  ORF type:complete len:294 (-),score=59.70 TRINITY_DN3526_c0_g1_i1:16-789(-)